MYQTTQGVYPVVQIFGPGYVPERHADQAQLSLLRADRVFYFTAILSSLRAALAFIAPGSFNAGNAKREQRCAHLRY
jgi:hypothetical protein